MWLEALRAVFIALGLAYLGLIVFALLLGERAVFPAPPRSYGPTEAIVMVPDPTTGQQIATCYLANTHAERAILYHYGNAEDLGTIQPRLEVLQAMGFAVFAYDYPGYGLSAGRPSERAVTAAARAAQAFLQREHGFAPEQVIHYGRSLGGGPATVLARDGAAGLILEGTFTSAFRVVTHVRLLPWDIFDTLGRIQAVGCPILILHGVEDATVPVSHGRRLAARATAEVQLVEIPGAGHNDVWEVGGEQVIQALSAFLPALAPPTN